MDRKQNGVSAHEPRRFDKALFIVEVLFALGALALLAAQAHAEDAARWLRERVRGSAKRGQKD